MSPARIALLAGASIVAVAVAGRRRRRRRA
jgi:hypothetical protein